MKREAILLYKLLSNIEFKLGFISMHEYYLRLLTLYNLSDFSKEIKIAIYENFEEQNISQIEYEDTPPFLDQNIRRNDESEFENSNPQDGFLYFITPIAGKFSKWLFRVGDPDFFPSIPHGHSTHNTKIKLDSYLGHFYNVSNKKTKSFPIGRENRQYIIDLWNNDPFRELAIKTIDWYLDTFPAFSWRVSKSRIRLIPKKR